MRRFLAGWTKPRVMYALLLLLTFLFTYLNNHRYAVMLLYAMLLLPLFSLLLAATAGLFIRVSQTLDRDVVVKNEETGYHFIIQNRFFFYYPFIHVVFDQTALGVVYRESGGGPSGKTALVFSLPPRAKRELVYPLSCRYRGEYAIGAAGFILRDFLGLFHFRRRMRGKLRLLVYPQVREEAGILHIISQQMKPDARPNTILEDYTDINDMRVYRPSDSLKKIHWKLTAKREELIVKNYAAATTHSVTMLLNTSQPDVRQWQKENQNALEDAIVEGLITAVNGCLKSQIPVEFLYGKDETMREYARDASYFESVYRIIAELTFNGKIDFIKLFNKFIDEQDDYVNAVLFTSRITRLLFEDILAAQKFGHHIMVCYYSCNDSFDPEMVGLLREHHIVHELFSVHV